MARITLVVAGHPDPEIPVLFPHVGIMSLPEIADVWIQDWAPLPVKKGTGLLACVKSVYDPGYLAGSPWLARKDQKAGRELAHLLGDLIELPLVLDGGGLVSNGQGLGICTERIVADNQGLHVHSHLRHALGISKLVVIPEEPFDVTGHVDGIVRFISPDTLIVGAYPPDYREGFAYMNEVAQNLASEVGDTFKIVRIENALPEMDGKEGMPSASGNYVNFLQSKNTICLPSYGLSCEPGRLARLCEELPMFTIVSTPNLRKVAVLGGSLHCITWQY